MVFMEDLAMIVKSEIYIPWAQKVHSYILKLQRLLYVSPSLCTEIFAAVKDWKQHTYPLNGGLDK